MAVPPAPGTSFGGEGVYLYRFQLFWSSASGARTLVTEWFCDPFARETDVGELSAVAASRAPAPIAWTDAAYRTPELDELIVYELQVEQFNDTFAGVIARIPYLQSLGVNCIELMPVTSTKMDFDWGYGPINYFAPAARFGGAAGLRALVDACHAANMAVILDVVYQHVDEPFAYHRVYADIEKTQGAPRVKSPMIGGMGPYGPTIDYTQPFAQDYVATCNRYWLDEYHVDGFRYDEAKDLYAVKGPTGGATGTSYALLAYGTYLHSLGIRVFSAGGPPATAASSSARRRWTARRSFSGIRTRAAPGRTTFSAAPGRSCRERRRPTLSCTRSIRRSPAGIPPRRRWSTWPAHPWTCPSRRFST